MLSRLRASTATLRFLRRTLKTTSEPASNSVPWDDLRKRSILLGVRLTDEELSRLQIGSSKNLAFTRRRFLRFARARVDAELERDAMLSAIELPAEASSLTKSVFPVISTVGNASWAIAGTQVAGDAGMNIVGCCFVGCVSALGGGTLNNLMFGTGTARQGVTWVHNPRSTVMVALAASVATFFAWPIICYTLAEGWLREVHTAAENRSWIERTKSWLRPLVGQQGEPQTITRAQFMAACQDPDFLAAMQKKLGPQMQSLGISAPRYLLSVSQDEDHEAEGSDDMNASIKPAWQRQATPTEYTAAQLFAYLDVDDNGVVDLSEVIRLVKLEFDGSSVRYIFDTIALSVSSVTGTAAAVARGLHPLVCIVSSVTMCFGGIARDLLCSREVAFGSQSFALSLAAGATVYVGLRELCLLGAHLPLGMRIVLSGGTTVIVRLVDYLSDGPLLTPMHTYWIEQTRRLQ